MIMKHLKLFEAFDISKRNDFVGYIMMFYGPNGIYREIFNSKLTINIIEKYVDKFIKKRGKDFNSDSFDRELYRDFLLVKLGISVISEVELNVMPFFTKSELKKADILHKAVKYNL